MGQQRNTSHKEKTVDYIDGNTVKKLQTAPKRRKEQTHQEFIKKQEQDKEQRARKRAARASARKNQERALQMNLSYVMFLAVVITVIAVVAGCYVKLQADITGKIKKVSTLKSKVLDLKTSNDAEQKRIDISIDLEEIRRKATEELGMVYPAKDQIIYYDVDTTDYMNQYEDIPEK
ncbi:MAG: hypothetical protein K1V96_07355 [Lachnospiraceae bacterium]